MKLNNMTHKFNVSEEHSIKCQKLLHKIMQDLMKERDEHRLQVDKLNFLINEIFEVIK